MVHFPPDPCRREKSVDSSEETKVKHYAGERGWEKKLLRRKRLGFPMLLHTQRDAPTSGCFTPNATTVPRCSLTRVSIKNDDDLQFTRRTIQWIVSFDLVMEDMDDDHRL
ncbi:hypothetical protein KSP40_PGU000293 [Platanthera guangdongensis]|uniref:Uncharacterized protein n=1 Tax=Platanthera guangdongensis TaxID=2320717 RepID=A0ABR2MEC1_9ASPA